MASQSPYTYTYSSSSSPAAVSSSSHSYSAASRTTPRGSTTLKSARLMQQQAPAQQARRSSIAATSSSAAAQSSSSSFMTQARRDGQMQSQVAHVPRNMTTSRRCLLPNTNLDHKVLLVLDMDETLLHASVQPTAAYDVNFVVPMDTQKVSVYVSFRPHMMDFLRTVSRWFEVAIFTASIPKYANQVLDYIDPSGRLIHHRLYREHCTECDGTYVKDLTLLNRPMDRLAIVDNSPVAYSFQPENALPIVSWFDDKDDNALPEMLPTLERLSRCRSVFEHIEEYKNAHTTARAPVRRYA